MVSMLHRSTTGLACCLGLEFAIALSPASAEVRAIVGTGEVNGRSVELFASGDWNYVQNDPSCYLGVFPDYAFCGLSSGWEVTNPAGDALWPNARFRHSDGPTFAEFGMMGNEYPKIESTDEAVLHLDALSRSAIIYSELSGWQLAPLELEVFIVNDEMTSVAGHPALSGSGGVGLADAPVAFTFWLSDDKRQIHYFYTRYGDDLNSEETLVRHNAALAHLKRLE